MLYKFGLVQMWTKASHPLRSRIHRHELVLGFAMFIFMTLYSYLSILKSSAFRSYAWDLGIFNQVMWTTTHDGKFFYYTLEQYIVPSGSFFGIHFSPILFLILPIYAVIPSANTLLVIQVVVLALACIPIYLLARMELGNPNAALMLAVAYLAYPFVQGMLWFDFHLEAFLPLFFGFSLYYLRREKWQSFLIFSGLSLCVIEQASVIVLFIGICLLLIWRNELLLFFQRRVYFKIKYAIPFLLVVLAISWYEIQTLVKEIFFPIDPRSLSIYYATANWRVLGISGNPFASIPEYIILHPVNVLVALEYSIIWKALFLLLLLLPLLFLPLRNLYILITASWLVPAFVSNWPPYYVIGDQYPGYVIPFLFAATIFSLKSFKAFRFRKLNVTRLSVIILIISLIMSVVIGPYSPGSQFLMQKEPQLYFDPGPVKISDHIAILHRIMDLIPAQSSVITQQNLFVELSNRTNAYAIGWDLATIEASQTLRQYVNQRLNESEFVLVDGHEGYFAAGSVALIALLDGYHSFGLYAYEDGVFLFKQGYQAAPVIYYPAELVLNYKNLTLNSGFMEKDSTSLSGTIMVHPAGASSNIDGISSGTFWFGPYTTILPPGHYSVSFRLKDPSASSKGNFTLDIVTNYGSTSLASETFSSNSFTAINVWQNFTVSLNLSYATSLIEFRCVNVSPTIALDLDYIQVT
jgi:uncharacterized membrane protein